MSDKLTVQAARDRLKIALRELFRIRRAARYQGDESKVLRCTEAINALKAEHAELSGIDADTGYKIVTDGFRNARDKLQGIVDERAEIEAGLKRAKKAVQAVEQVLRLFA